jgi:mannose-6-phosphate isomerase
MSHAFLFTRDERFRKAALDAWAEMKARMRDEQGFIRPQATREFGAMPDAAPEHPLYLEFRAATPPAGPYPPSTVNNQNPMMHLFEALLALHDATGSRDVLRDAEDLAGRIFTRLFQEREGYLPEMYDADWQPLPQDKRGYIELGHQFEWAYLLSRGAEHGLAPRFLEIGRRLLDYGMNHAYDAANGGIFSRANYAGEVSSGGKGAWEQCEALRAMMHYAALRGRADLWPAFDKSLAFVKQFFLDDECGGWYTSYNPRSPRTERQSFKGSLGKAGYHDTGMYVEGLRLAGTLPALKR